MITVNLPIVDKVLERVAARSLVYLSKRAIDRGEFHELNHILLAMHGGNSVHGTDECCELPTGRKLGRDEVWHHLNLKAKESSVGTGLYL